MSPEGLIRTYLIFNLKSQSQLEHFIFLSDNYFNSVHWLFWMEPQSLSNNFVLFLSDFSKFSIF